MKGQNDVPEIDHVMLTPKWIFSLSEMGAFGAGNYQVVPNCHRHVEMANFNFCKVIMGHLKPRKMTEQKNLSGTPNFWSYRFFCSVILIVPSAKRAIFYGVLI